MMLQGAEREFNMGWNSKRVVLGLRLGCAVLLAVGLSVMVSFATPGFSQAAAASQETTIKFDIEAQPLASALDRYGDATGREVFYDTALAQGRRSGGVKGTFGPVGALQVLLEGTGLSARFMADGSFVLLSTPPLSRQPAVRAAPPAVHQRYYARIQENLRDAFCRRSDAQPGRYRVVAVLWIGPYGDVQRVQRLGSAGTIDVDRGIDATLRGLRLDEPPPAGFKQPVLIMIVPQAAGVTIGCRSGGAGLHPVRADQP
jgi:hypothetical protein